MVNEMRENVKGYKRIAKATQGIDLTNGRTQNATKVYMYYDEDKRTLYTEPGSGRELVTWWLNPATEDDVLKALKRWLWA